MTSATAAERLLEKYQEIYRLRSVDCSTEQHEVRDQMRRLAARYPGALRELDRLPPEVLDARIIHLQKVIAGEESALPWVALLDAFHTRLRAEVYANGDVPQARPTNNIRERHALINKQLAEQAGLSLDEWQQVLWGELLRST